MSKKIKLCANGMSRATATGQSLYVRNGCTMPARPGHIHCENCRREQGGYYVRQPRVLDKPAGSISV